MAVTVTLTTEQETTLEAYAAQLGLTPQEALAEVVATELARLADLVRRQTQAQRVQQIEALPDADKAAIDAEITRRLPRR